MRTETTRMRLVKRGRPRADRRGAGWWYPRPRCLQVAGVLSPGRRVGAAATRCRLDESPDDAQERVLREASMQPPVALYHCYQ
jgi:hypothetical protein